MKRAANLTLLCLLGCRVDFDRERLAEPPPATPVDKCPAPTKPQCTSEIFEPPRLLVRNTVGYEIGGASTRTYAGQNEVWLHFNAAHSNYRLAALPAGDDFTPTKIDWFLEEDSLPVLDSAGLVNVDPAFAATGSWVVWSTRIGGGAPLRLRFATFDAVANDWTRPVALSSFDTIGKDQFGPSPSANGCRLFFTAGERDGSGDIYLASGEPGAWGPPAPIENPSDPASKYDDTEPTPSADGKTVIFASNRESKGGAKHTLWISRQESGASAGVPVFSTPQPLPSDGINGTDNITGPHLSFDGCTLLFTKNKKELWVSRRPKDPT